MSSSVFSNSNRPIFRPWSDLSTAIQYRSKLAAVSAIGKGGTIVVVGVFGEKPRVDLGLVQDRELTLRGTLMYRKEDYQSAVALLANGQVAAAPLDSRHFPFAQYDDAYTFIQRQGDKCVKVFVDLD